MARPLRIEFPGAVYHVTARGDRRALLITIFILSRSVHHMTLIFLNKAVILEV